MHRAIKLSRLDALVPQSLGIDNTTKLDALNETSWDVAKAAGMLLAAFQPSDDVTQV